jgi:hypothetical protein
MAVGLSGLWRLLGVWPKGIARPRVVSRVRVPGRLPVDQIGELHQLGARICANGAHARTQLVQWHHMAARF